MVAIYFLFYNNIFCIKGAILLHLDFSEVIWSDKKNEKNHVWEEG